MMRVITTSVGKKPTLVPVCESCGDLVWGRPAGGRCQHPPCRRWYSSTEIAAALAAAEHHAEEAAA